MNSILCNDLFPSIISDIKNYTGKDPLLPWLRGIKKMKDSLPPQLLREKLPRFLQKCAQAFEADQRYANDLRYLRVWLQLMDFVDEPKAVLKTMELNRIGMKKTLFYKAYALYYEKMKKFESADKMYRLGAQNLAEPMDELNKSYEQFLLRMVNHKNKKTQRNGGMVKKMPQTVVKVPLKFDNSKRTNGNVCMTGEQGGILLDASSAEMQHLSMNNQTKALPRINNGEACSGSLAEKGTRTGLGCKSYYKESESKTKELRKVSSDDTVLARFVDTAIMGKSNTEEDSRHHGLVEPTINTKEAMLVINSMFQEPLGPPLTGRRCKNYVKADESSNCGFEVFVDENSNDKVGTAHQDVAKHSAVLQSSTCGTAQQSQQHFQIYIDDKVGTAHQDVAKHAAVLQNSTCGTAQQSQQHFQIYIDDEKSNDETEVDDREYEMDYPGCPESNNFFSPNSEDLPSEVSQEHTTKPPHARLREDTGIYRFVGSTITDEPQVENACHHGLVEPTVNLKEAMDDINSMFGKPIEFVRKGRSKKQEKPPSGNSNAGGFLILPDDTTDCKQDNSKPSSSTNKGKDLFEQTICTKEAMDEINNLFKMPLDF